MSDELRQAIERWTRAVDNALDVLPERLQVQMTEAKKHIESLTILERGKTYEVIKVEGDQIHRPQGGSIDAIRVGDIVTISPDWFGVWTNQHGAWCWAIEKDDRYGAAFHSSHLREIEGEQQDKLDLPA